MRNVAADLCTLIAAGTAYVGGVNLFAGRLPSQAKGEAVWVTEDISAIDPFIGERDAVTVTCNVSIRGNGGRQEDGLRDRAFGVLAAVHRASASPYVSIIATSLPDLEEDQADKPVYTFSVDCTFTMEATGPLVILPPDGPLEVEALRTGEVITDLLTFGDGSTLTSAPPPVDLSGYAPISSPIFTGPVMPATAGQQALGSAAVPWGPVHASAPVGQDAMTIPGGSRFRYGEHPNAVFRTFTGATNPILIFDGGIQTAGAFVNGQLRRTGLVASAPGNTTLHSHFSGRAAVAAGQTSMTIFSNSISHGLSSLIISPRQIDPSVKAWSAVTTASFTATITLDAPASADWWFDFIILT